jgi:hypothetical protein
MATDSPNIRCDHVYAIIRIDRDEATSGMPWRDLITVKKIVRSKELSEAGSSDRHQPVDGVRREDSLSAFCVYRLSRKDFRPARRIPEPLRFERELPGAGRNSPGSPRTPKLSRQNSQSPF